MRGRGGGYDYTARKPRAPSPSEWGVRVGAAYTQTGVLGWGGRLN